MYVYIFIVYLFQTVSNTKRTQQKRKKNYHSKFTPDACCPDFDPIRSFLEPTHLYVTPDTHEKEKKRKKKKKKKVADNRTFALDITCCYRLSGTDVRRIICPLSGLSVENIQEHTGNPGFYSVSDVPRDEF